MRRVAYRHSIGASIHARDALALLVRGNSLLAAIDDSPGRRGRQRRRVGARRRRALHHGGAEQRGHVAEYAVDAGRVARRHALLARAVRQHDVHEERRVGAKALAAVVALQTLTLTLTTLATLTSTMSTLTTFMQMRVRHDTLMPTASPVAATWCSVGGETLSSSPAVVGAPRDCINFFVSASNLLPFFAGDAPLLSAASSGCCDCAWCVEEGGVCDTFLPIAGRRVDVLIAAFTSLSGTILPWFDSKCRCKCTFCKSARVRESIQAGNELINI